MDLQEIFNAACGANEENEPKSIVSLSILLYNEANDSFVTKCESVAQKPIVSITPVGDVSHITLLFPSPFDTDLKVFWSTIQLYEKEVDNTPTDANEFPLLMVNIIPSEFNGNCYISAILPLYCALQAPTTGSQADTIGLFFESDNVSFYETDDVDGNKIQSEVDRELAEEERQEEMAEKKRLEREELINKRNTRFQDRRRGQ